MSSKNGKTFTNSIVLTRVADGQSANSLIIETPYEEILKFDTEGGLQFTPEFFEFKVYDLASKLYKTNFAWTCAYLNAAQEFINIGSSDTTKTYPFNSCFGYKTAVGEDSDIRNSTTLVLDVVNLYEQVSANSEYAFLKEGIEEGSVVLKFVHDPLGEVQAIKYIAIKNGVSADMAKLNIGANDIVASIRDTSLKFSSDGLDLVNGDFSIYDFVYKPIILTAESFETNKYYKLDGNSKPQLAISFEEGVQYYEQYKEAVFYADGVTGDLTLKGNVYANNGVFRGDVFANNGTFNGQITATGGNIGGFNIYSAYFDKVATPINPVGYYVLVDVPLNYFCQILSIEGALYVQIQHQNNYFQIVSNPKEEDRKNYFLYNSQDGYYILPDGEEFNSGATYYEIFEPFESFHMLNQETPAKLVEVLDPIENQIYYAKLKQDSGTILFTAFYQDLGGRMISPDGGIVLDGTGGKISANNIDLGAGARVTDKIVFSNSKGTTPSFALYNPELNEHFVNETQGGKVLESSQITMTNRGYLNIGSIELFGGTGTLDGYMRSVFVDGSGQTSNGYWCVREDGSAYFDNITANDLHIQKSVLEIDTVQSVGGTMIFKDAWTILETIIFEIEGVKGFWYRLDKIADIHANDYIMVDKNFYKVSAVKEIEGSYTIFSIYGEDNKFGDIKEFSETNENDEVNRNTKVFSDITQGMLTKMSKLKMGAIISKFGAAGKLQWIKASEDKKIPGRFYFIKNEANEYIPYNGLDLIDGIEYYYIGPTPSNDCIISVRSSHTSFEGPGYAYSSPQSFCFSSFCDYGTPNNPKLAFTKHLILGNLKDSGIDELSGIEGYGLYADNVYLNGALTTRGIAGTSDYAGINTIGGAKFNKDSTDTSSIILWGGAKGKENELIQNAPFQVTAQGTLYAQKAILEDSVIVGGTLRAAKVETAEIFGTKDGADAALTIYDANFGIVFKNNKDTIHYEEIILTKDSFESNKYYVLNGKNYILATGFVEGTKYYEEIRGDEVFSIGAQGLVKGAEYFIDIAQDPVRFYGNFESKTSNLTTYYYGNGIQFIKNSNKLPFAKITPQINTTNIDGDEGVENQQLIINVGLDLNEIVVFEQEKMISNVNGFFAENLSLGKQTDGTYFMEQKLVKNGNTIAGYDIYIY